MRRNAVVAKGMAVACEIVIVCVVAGLTILIFDPLVGLDLSLTKQASAMASLAALGLLYGWLALAVAGFTPNKALATAVPAALAAAGYLIAGLHDLAGWLDPLRYVSAFWWVGRPKPIAVAVKEIDRGKAKENREATWGEKQGFIAQLRGYAQERGMKDGWMTTPADQVSDTSGFTESIIDILV